MKNSYINKIGQVIQPKDLEKTADEINEMSGGGGSIPSSTGGHTVTIQNVTSGSVGLLKTDGTTETASTAGTYANVIAILYDYVSITNYAGYYMTNEVYFNNNSSVSVRTSAQILLSDIVISNITGGSGG